MQIAKYRVCTVYCKDRAFIFDLLRLSEAFGAGVYAPINVKPHLPLPGHIGGDLYNLLFKGHTPGAIIFYNALSRRTQYPGICIIVYNYAT